MDTSMYGRLRLRSTRWWHVILVSLLIGTGCIAAIIPAAHAAGEIGYRGFSYGTTCNSTPTGEKPESKLWWNDGFWWGSLCNPTANKYHIYRLNVATQQWEDTGTVLDERPSSKADALWDPTTQKLYLVSHLFTTSGTATTSSSWGRLYRYSYNASTKTYTRDAGFPVLVTGGKSETLVIDKDSTGRLWVTYVEAGKVMVNHSIGSDTEWGVPFVLPVSRSETVSVATDDISSVVAFGGNQIGVMWSNQSTSKMYFAVHRDGDPADVWQMEETALPGPNDCTGACADDHINLKGLQVDTRGRVYAAIKTSLDTSSAPLVMLLVRDESGSWASHVFGRKSDHHTRPIVLLDEEQGRLYMFATAPEADGVIYYKSTDIDNISFVSGLGEPFIKASALTINNATSTKQNVNSTTGLVVLASDDTNLDYWHNYLSLSAGGPIPTATPMSTATSTATATATSTATPTNTAEAPTVTATATQTPIASPTATPTATASASTSFAFSAVADTYVSQSKPTTSYASNKELQAVNGSSAKQAFIRFDVKDLPAGASVSAAKLRLVVTNDSTSGGIFHRVTNTTWPETITWNTKPAIDGAQLASLGSVALNQVVEVALPAGTITGNGLYSFAITLPSNNTNTLGYASRQHTTVANRPQLVITTE